MRNTLIAMSCLVTVSVFACTSSPTVVVQTGTAGSTGSAGAGAAGENSSTAGTTGGAGGYQSSDAAAQGTSYTCAGEGSSETCVVGQTFCYRDLGHGGASGTVESCESFETDGGTAACAQDPNCACVCGHGGFNCTSQEAGGACSCDETNGFVTISCEGI
jgi:hypothetical protein